MSPLVLLKNVVKLITAVQISKKVFQDPVASQLLCFFYELELCLQFVENKLEFCDNLTSLLLGMLLSVHR